MRTRSVLLLLIFSSVMAVAALANETRQKTTAPQAKPPDLSTISVNGVGDIDPAKAFGSRDAVLVIEIFSDFQCPTCKQLYQATLTRVMDTYVSNTTACKIYVVHRDFPLPYHAYARTAASYSRAAAHIGKCAEVETALFQNQEKWEANGDVKAIVAAVLAPGEMKRVQTLVDSRTLEPLIDRDTQLGLTLPVHATPTMVIHTCDGHTYPISGMVSYDVLNTFLDKLTRESSPSSAH
jgi:protein-disulfide isomerase